MENWTEIKITVPVERVDEAGAIASMTVPYGIYIEDYSHLEQEAVEIAKIDLIDEELLQKDRTKGKEQACGHDQVDLDLSYELGQCLYHKGGGDAGDGGHDGHIASSYGEAFSHRGVKNTYAVADDAKAAAYAHAAFDQCQKLFSFFVFHRCSPVFLFPYIIHFRNNYATIISFLR